MPKVDNFEDLIIWQQSRQLAKEIYQITRTGDFRFDMRFVQQIRAAAGSIMDNIAEGFERDGNKEFVQFLYIAKGSCGEVRSQLYRALDAGFITPEQHESLQQAATILNKGLYNFIRSIKNSSISGQKYRPSEPPETRN